MKKLLGACFLACLATISCSKSSDDLTPIVEPYMTLTAGSVWNYDQKDLGAGGAITPFTLTSTNRDSSILGTSYHVFLNSMGTTEYYNINSDNEYRVYQDIPAMFNATTKVIFYLDTDFPAGSTWSQNFNIILNGIPQTLVRNYSILEKGSSRTVNGHTYDNVICVKSTYTLPALPPALLTSNIKTYFAPHYGLIEDSTSISLNTLTGSSLNTNTILKSAVLQ